MHMAVNKIDRISSYFRSVLHDVTPHSAYDDVSVLYAPVSDNPEISRLCATVLSEKELTRAHRFSSECDAALFKQRRAFRRFCGAIALGSSQPLSQVEYDETKKGRPYLNESPDIRFSFSSCRFGFLERGR